MDSDFALTLRAIDLLREAGVEPTLEHVANLLTFIGRGRDLAVVRRQHALILGIPYRRRPA